MTAFPSPFAPFALIRVAGRRIRSGQPVHRGTLRPVLGCADEASVIRRVVDDDGVADGGIVRLEPDVAAADDRVDGGLPPSVCGEGQIDGTERLLAGAVEDRGPDVVWGARLIEAADVRARVRVDGDAAGE